MCNLRDGCCGGSGGKIERHCIDQGVHGAMEKMHQGMQMSYSGDADVDFVRGMIPYHQGAVDMTKVELAYGKDPALRKLAEDIVSS